MDATSPSPLPRFDGPVVELDVREDLRQRREPFSRIMAAVAALAPGEALRLRTTFEPVPLFAAMAKRGFGHHAHAHAPLDWSVWFFRPEDAPVLDAPESAAAPTAACGYAPAAGDGRAASEIVLDVRGLVPPEPLVRTLEALQTLPAGATLVQHNDRVPQFLLPMLYDSDAAAPGGGVLVRIRRQAA